MNKLKELWQKILTAFRTKKWLRWMTIGVAAGLAVAALTVGLVIGLGDKDNSADNSGDPTCTHVWEERSTTASTCVKQGSITYKCKNCDGVKTEKVALASHDFKDEKCIVCGETAGSKGLSFTLDDSGEYYIADGVGTCRDKTLFIPSQYEGKPVKAIASQAFRGNKRLESVSIGAAIERIGEYAFYWNENLVELTFSTGLQKVEVGAFSGCSKLEKVQYNGELSAWCGVAFAEEANPLQYAKNLYIKGEIPTGNVVIPDGVTSIPAYTFKNSGVTGVSIPDSVLTIGVDAFANTEFYKNTANWTDGVLYSGKHLLAADKEAVLQSYALKEDTICIADNAFAYCKIIEITLSQSLKAIGAEAFLNTSLQKIELGEQLSRVGKNAFTSCTTLSEVTFKNVNGWTANGENIDVSDAKAAATCLVSTHKDALWTRRA